MFTSYNESHGSAVLMMDEFASMLLTDCNNVTIANLIFKLDNVPVMHFEETTGFLSQISVLGHTPIKLFAAIVICSSHIEICSDVMVLNVTSDQYNDVEGAALSAFGGTISYHGVNVFINNTAIDHNGGALCFFSSHITFYGKTFFINNTAALSLKAVHFEFGGGAIIWSELHDFILWLGYFYSKSS